MNPPFDITRYATGEDLVGRGEDLRWLMNGIRAGAKLLLESPARMGATSLIHEASGALARQAHGRVLRLDLAVFRDLSEVTQTLQQAAAPLMKSGAGAGSGIVADMVKVGGSFLLPGLEEGAAGPDVAGLIKVLERLHRHATQRTGPLLVVFDGLQHAERLGLASGLDALGHASQRHRGLSYLFVGDRVAVSQAAGRLFFEPGQSSVRQELRPVDPQTLAAWIDARFKAQGIVTAGVGSTCVERGGPRTGDIVDLAQRALGLAQRAGFANRATVDAALAESIRAHAEKSRRAWEGLNEPEQAVLKSVAAGNGLALGSPGGYRLCGLENDGNVAQAIEGLLAKRMIDRSGDAGLKVESPALRGWTLQAQLSWKRTVGGAAEVHHRLGFDLQFGRTETPRRSLSV